MPNWLDGVADQFLDGSKSLICGIYKISPTAALAKLAGNAGFTPAQALTEAWNSACGAPNPSMSTSGSVFGPCPSSFAFQLRRSTDGLVLVGTNARFRLDYTWTLLSPNNNGNSVWRWTATDNVGCGTVGALEYVVRDAVGAMPYMTVEPLNNGPAPNLQPSGGYPPLTPQQDQDLGRVLEQLAAIRNTQGLQTAALAGLAAGSAANLAATAGVAAAVAGVAAEVAALSAALAALSAAITALRALVQAIQDVLGNPAYNDLDGVAVSTFAQACGSFNSAARRIVEDIGIPVGGYLIEGNNGVLADSLAGLVGYIDSILGLSSRLEIDLCGQRLSFGAVGELLEEIVKGVVAAEPVMGLGIGADGQPPQLCTVAQIAENLLQLQGDLVILQGIDAPVLRERLLKLVYNNGQRYQQHSYVNVPNPIPGLTNEIILAAAGPRRLGEWLVKIRFESRRQMMVWSESEATGIATLEALADLSLDKTVNLSFTSTRAPRDSPKKHRNGPLNCTRAFLVDVSADGGEATADFYPQRSAV